MRCCQSIDILENQKVKNLTFGFSNQENEKVIVNMTLRLIIINLWWRCDEDHFNQDQGYQEQDKTKAHKTETEPNPWQRL